MLLIVVELPDVFGVVTFTKQFMNDFCKEADIALFFNAFDTINGDGQITNKRLLARNILFEFVRLLCTFEFYKLNFQFLNL